jgi:hypothetical protein
MAHIPDKNAKQIRDKRKEPSWISLVENNSAEPETQQTETQACPPLIPDMETTAGFQYLPGFTQQINSVHGGNNS